MQAAAKDKGSKGSFKAGTSAAAAAAAAVLQNRLTACLCHCNYIYEDLLLIQVCSDPTSMHCCIGFGKCHTHCPGLLCKTGSQLACVTAITSMEICCSYKGAVTHNQCTAALGFGKMPYTLSSAAQQNSLTAGLCYCNYTFEDLLLIQMCSGPQPMHCSTRFGKLHSPLCSAGLQNRLTAGFCHCNYIYKDLLLIQGCSDPQPMRCSTGFGKVHSSLSSAGLQNMLTAGLFHCDYIYGDVLFLQVGSDPPPMHCKPDFDKMPHTLSSAALQNRLTACLCNCNFIYEDLLLIQVCSDPTQMHCRTAFGKIPYTLSSAVLQNRLTTGLCHCNYTFEDLLLIQMCSDPPSMHCSTGFGKCHTHCPVLLCKTGSLHACVTVTTSMEICCSYKCAVPQNQLGFHFTLNSALMHLWWVTAHLYEEQVSMFVIALTHCLLLACFAEQQWTLGIAFCPEHTCSAFVLGHCTPA